LLSYNGIERFDDRHHHDKELSMDAAANRLDLSEHAQIRCSQRNVTPDEMLYIMQHGTLEYRTGIRYYFLRWRDVPSEDRADQRIAQLVGTSVLTNSEGAVIITVRRNGDAWKKDRRKSKYAWSGRMV
jgi:hypothetical protein